MEISVSNKKNPLDPFTGSIRTAGNEYTINQVKADSGGYLTEFVSGDHRIKNTTIDHAPGGSVNELGKFIKDGNVFIVSTLGNTPILTLWKNKHHWNSEEYIVPTREKMMLVLKELGFNEPWLLFNKTSVYPSRIRVVPYKANFSKDISKIMETMEHRKQPFEDFRDYIDERIAPLVCAVPDRFIEVDYLLRLHHLDRIEAIADLVNYFFFKFGKVLVSLRSPDREFSDYHDLKAIVDKKSTFFPARINNGWDNFLKASK